MSWISDCLLVNFCCSNCESSMNDVICFEYVWYVYFCCLRDSQLTKNGFSFSLKLLRSPCRRPMDSVLSAFKKKNSPLYVKSEVASSIGADMVTCVFVLPSARQSPNKSSVPWQLSSVCAVIFHVLCAYDRPNVIELLVVDIDDFENISVKKLLYRWKNASHPYL